MKKPAKAPLHRSNRDDPFRLLKPRFFLTAKDYRFSIPLADALQANVNVGSEVEFELPRNKKGKVKILRY